MTKRVQLSTWSYILTLLVIGVMTFALIYCQDVWTTYIIAFVFLGLIVAALFYMPLSITVNPQGLQIHRPLRTKRLPLQEIEDVTLSKPTMGEMRLCGSGGWLGYWGYFRQSDIGRYFAYYGKASDCFLVTLTDGRRYLLGCRQPQEIVDYIDQLKKQK